MCDYSGDCQCNKGPGGARCLDCAFGIHRCGHKRNCHKHCKVPRVTRIWGS
jgi:hypothetical protein